jgi:hypothetical protein
MAAPKVPLQSFIVSSFPFSLSRNLIHKHAQLLPSPAAKTGMHKACGRISLVLVSPPEVSWTATFRFVCLCSSIICLVESVRWRRYRGAPAPAQGQGPTAQGVPRPPGERRHADHMLMLTAYDRASMRSPALARSLPVSVQCLSNVQCTPLATADTASHNHMYVIYIIYAVCYTYMQVRSMYMSYIQYM